MLSFPASSAPVIDHRRIELDGKPIGTVEASRNGDFHAAINLMCRSALTNLAQGHGKTVDEATENALRSHVRACRSAIAEVERLALQMGIAIPPPDAVPV